MKMTMQNWLLGVMLLALTQVAVAASGVEIIRTSSGKVTLNRSDSAYVMVPADGRMGGTNYGGSGIEVSSTLAGAFSRYLTTSMGRQGESLEDALKAARKHNLGYVIMPTILHWEDRKSQWSMQPDRISLKLSIYNAKTGKELDEVVINNRSSRMNWGGKPQDLLNEPFASYAATVF
jgi:hypothetical protein